MKNLNEKLGKFFSSGCGQVAIVEKATRVFRGRLALTMQVHTPPSTAHSVSGVLSSSHLRSFLVTPAVSFQKKPIGYSLLINPSSLFSISAETGEISLTHPIDYESDQHRYLLLVRASEGLDSMSSAAEVCVCVCVCDVIQCQDSTVKFNGLQTSEIVDITRLSRQALHSRCSVLQTLSDNSSN